METLWEKILFWKKSKKMLKEGIDYHFFDFKDSDISGIELLMKEYQGVIYHYQKARVVEEGEFGRLQFGYSIIHPGNHTVTELHEDENFVTIMGEILTQVLMKKLNDETGKDNTQKFGV